MLLSIGVFYFAYIFLKVYVAVMEIGYVKKAKLLPAIILSEENYKKAADYKVVTERFGILSTLYDYAIFIFWFCCGLKWLDNTIFYPNPLIEAVLFVDSFIIINYFLTLPFDLYKTFVIDKKFGFSTITFKMFVIDSIKSGILFLVFGSLVI